LSKVARHTAGQGLQGCQRQARPFVQDPAAKKPANTSAEKWATFLGPAVVWMRGELVHGRTPEPIGRGGSWYLYPGQVGANASLAVQPQRLQVIGPVERHQRDGSASWTIHRISMGLWTDFILLLRYGDRRRPLLQTYELGPGDLVVVAIHD